ncbi:unnamed protein product [Malus baccata var. baccata]
MEEARKLRSEFLQVLRSRRSVPMLVEPAKPVANPLFQEANPPNFSEVRIWFPFGNALYQFGTA